MPLVSVLMPVYNGQQYVKDAISSILTQTLSDFEFIIIDDGSTDGTPEILQQYAAADRRIRLIRHENRGIIDSLNEALGLARADYVARMDADDISLLRRLETQARYLDQNPNTGIVGTSVKYIGPSGSLYRQRNPPLLPASPGVLRWFLMFGNCVFHPTVMARRKTLEQAGAYRKQSQYAEDLDLWLRASRTTQIVNLSEVLLHYRLYPTSVSSRHAVEQAKLARSLRARFIDDTLDVTAEDRILQILENTTGKEICNSGEVRQAVQLLWRIYRQYCGHAILTPRETNYVAIDMLRRILTLARIAPDYKESIQVLRGMGPLVPEVMSFRSVQTLRTAIETYVRLHRTYSPE